MLTLQLSQRTGGPEGTSDRSGAVFMRDRVKKILIQAALIFVFIGVSGFAAGYAQQQYHYRIGLKDVNDPAAAKMVTDVLRPVFNTPEAPFNCFPWFDDKTDQFDFRSDIAVTKEQLEAVLTANGIELTAFSSSDYVEPETEKQ